MSKRTKGRVLARINSLAPGFRGRCQLFLILAADQGIPLRVTQGRRSKLQQGALYAQGRESRKVVNTLRQKAGMAKLRFWQRNRKVTGLPPGSSKHEYGLAMDIVPMKWQQWLLPDWASPYWDELGELGNLCGLTWGGKWRNPDRPHFEDPEPIPRPE